MLKRMVGGAVLVLLVSVGTAVAAEKKMTREAYKASLAEYADREAAATQQIAEINAHLATLGGELSGLERDVARLRSNILSLVGSEDPEVMAFGRQLSALISQLEGLLALPPESLAQRRCEFEAAKVQVVELKSSKVSTLPEMRAKLDRIDAMIAELDARLAKPARVSYTVARGDNLWSIAKKDAVYADPYMWPRIYRANRDGIQDPDLIYPDQTLTIPFGVGQGQYLVNRGDFLSQIAASVYNDPTQWHRIYEANKQQIVEPQMIFPAQVLEIPSN